MEFPKAKKLQNIVVYNADFGTYIPGDNRVLGSANSIEHPFDLCIAHPAMGNPESHIIWPCNPVATDRD
jgi:hypothetical protein